MIRTDSGMANHTQESEAIEKTKKLHRANDAKRIMSEPLIQEFFETHTKMCVDAFKNLPMGSTIEEYQTVHHDILAVERLQNTLSNYIMDYDIIMYQDNKDSGRIHD